MRPRIPVRPCVRICAAAAGLSLGPVSLVSQEALRQTSVVESVRVEVVWTGSQAELDARRREYAGQRPKSSVIQEKLEAFSVLGRRDGELVCLIFAPKPARFDDRINTSLGHELLHCFGFSHLDR